MVKAIWQRHPRYVILVGVAILTTLYLLVPYQPSFDGNLGFKAIISGADLENRVRQANIIYDRLLVNRKGLIEKFGPDPKDIALYVACFCDDQSLTGLCYAGFRPMLLPGPPTPSVSRRRCGFRGCAG